MRQIFLANGDRTFWLVAWHDWLSSPRSSEYGLLLHGTHILLWLLLDWVTESILCWLWRWCSHLVLVNTAKNDDHSIGGTRNDGFDHDGINGWRAAWRRP